MLVLQRVTDQRIVVDLRQHGIAEPMVITVISVRGDSVRLGIDVDRSVPVHREELFLEIERDREAGSDYAS